MNPINWPDLFLPPINLWNAPRMDPLKSLDREAKRSNITVNFKNQKGHGEIELIKPDGNITSVTYSKPEHQKAAMGHAVELIHAMRSAG